MFLPFIYELRRRKVAVGAQEAVALARALAAGLHESSLDGFYHVARALLIHKESDLDSFDQAFAETFRGAEKRSLEIQQALLDWLNDALKSERELTPEERAIADALNDEDLRKMFEERLREQTERHDGGNRWIGTGGTSPFGNAGAKRPGIRVGGSSRHRSAISVADARSYAPYRNDLTLDTRQLELALRKLRAFAREGSDQELDVDATIDETAKNAGELSIKTRPPRRPNTRVILMMDVGGSMDPYVDLVSKLFSAARRATHFKELRTYYFHNCVYGRVYATERFDNPVLIQDLLHECGPHYKLVMVGDALMAPYELLNPEGGFLVPGVTERMAGIQWLTLLSRHFERSVWLNPETPSYWHGNTIEYVRQAFEMFPLTLEGLGEAVQHLVRGRVRKAAA